jgi:ectoine hydrolase
MNEPDLIGYPDYFVQSDERHPMEYLPRSSTERGWHTGSIGVEMDNYWFSAKGFAVAQKPGCPTSFSDVTASSTGSVVRQIAAELDRMRKAAQDRREDACDDRRECRARLRKCDLVADIYDASLRYDDEWDLAATTRPSCRCCLRGRTPLRPT